MADLADELRGKCEQAPQESVSVVIVLTEGAAHLPLSDLGLVDATEIPYQHGMLRLTAPGQRVLELAQRDEIEEIGEDIEVHPTS